MSLVSDELDYKKYTSSRPSYTFSKILPQNGSQTVTLSAAGGEETIFELPPKVFNGSKSIFAFSQTPPQGTHYNKMFVDTVPSIRQIQLYTRTGLYLVDLNYANDFTNSISRHETPVSEILANDKIDNDIGYWEGLYPSNVLGKDAATENIVRPAAAAGDGGIDLSGKTSIIEPEYCLVGTDNEATPVINYKFPLRYFKETGFEVDKDLYFGGETLYLKIVWDSYTRIGYNTTHDDNNNTGAAALTAGTISGITLFLAIEQNPVIENAIKSKVMSPEGLSLYWPMVYTNLVPLAAGVSALHSIQVRYNRGNGRRLKKIYWVPFNQTRTTYRSFDHDNTGGKKFTSFHTTVNNLRTSQFDYAVVAGEDWMVKKDSLKGSCILSSDEYYYNFTWIEDFTGSMSLLEKSKLPDLHNIDDGLDLTSEVIYTVNAINNNKAINHHIFAVCQKELTINANGIQLL